MKRLFQSIAVISILVLLLTASFAAAQDERTVVIGFTASTTGRYNVESTRQINGLNLWLNEVNDAGGITLSDGTVITFDTVFYDDESSSDRVQELYTRLATEDEADFFISPYSSGLTDASAVIAEQYGTIMITCGAASDSTYERGLSLVYQTYTPASRYLTGALDLLAETDPDATDIAIVHENDRFSTDVSTSLADYAEELGYNIVLMEGYDSGTTDFAPFINRIESAEPDAVLGGGHFQDGSTFARQLYEKETGVGFVALLVAPPEPSFAELGDAALGVIGPSQWEPLSQVDAEAAEAVGLEFFGPSSPEFVAAYEEAYDEEPSYHAAGGYIAGLLLQKAIMDADSLDTDAVAEALDNLDLLTFFGHIQFDTSEDAHGLQVGHSMMYVQWQEGEDGLAKQIVWPTEAVTAETLYPLGM